MVCLFPGGLDRNGMNNRFPALCFKGIGASDVGVVPVGVAGTDEMFRDGVPVTWPRRGVHVVVGDCIAAAGSDKEVAGLSSEAVRNALLLAKQNSTS